MTANVQVISIIINTLIKWQQMYKLYQNTTCTFAVIWFVLSMLLMYLYREGLVSCKKLFPIQLYRYWQ
jgi:hypothetical protein